MASIVAYYRPRGIKGNYKVGILLELLPSERAKVFRREDTKPKEPPKSMQQSIADALNSVRPGGIVQEPKEKPISFLDYDLPDPVQQKPVRTTVKSAFLKKDQRKIELYVLSRFTLHTRGETAIIEIYDADIADHQSEVFKATQHTVEDVGVTLGVKLNKITLIDLDHTDATTLQKYKSEIQQVRQLLQGT